MAVKFREEVKEGEDGGRDVCDPVVVEPRDEGIVAEIEVVSELVLSKNEKLDGKYSHIDE